MPFGFCKPDSVHPRGGCVVIFLAAFRPCPDLRGATITRGIAGRRPFPCLSCIAWGLPCLLSYPRSGGLLLHLFTLTLAGGFFSVALSVNPT